MNNLRPPNLPPIGSTDPGIMDIKAGKQRELQRDLPQQPPLELTRDLSRRIRILEEQSSNIRKSMQLSEQNVIRIGKDVKSELAVLNSEISEVKAEINEVKDELKLIVAELKETAKKDDVQVLEKYINLWEPLKFCTPKDVEQIIRRVLQQNQK